MGKTDERDLRLFDSIMFCGNKKMEKSMKPSTKETLREVRGIAVLSLMFLYAIWMSIQAEKIHTPPVPVAVALPCKTCYIPSFEIHRDGECPWCVQKKSHVRRAQE